MKKKFYLAVALVAALAFTGVTYAQVTTTTSVGVSAAGVAGAFVNVKTPSTAGFTNLKWQQNPSWSPIENVSSRIAAGDVYHIDTTNYSGDIRVTLRVTNVPELASNYSYLNMQANVWTKVATTANVASETITLGEETEVLDESVTILVGAGTLANGEVKVHSETVKDGAITLARGTDYTINYITSAITLSTDGYYTDTGDYPATVTVSYTYFNTSGSEAGSWSGGLVYFPVLVNSLTLEDSDNTSATYGATLAKGTDYIIAYDTGVITLATGGLFTLTTDFPATVDAVNQSGSYGYEYYTYAESWTQATLADGSAIGTQYLTLTNGFVDFILPGNAYYDITIDNGSLYCISTLEDDTHNLSPYFFLEVRQA